MALTHTQTAYERDRIERISEEDFWSAWSAREPAMKEALALGKAGRKGRAYPALAGYHRESLAAEYDFVREEAEIRNATPRARRLAAGKELPDHPIERRQGVNLWEIFAPLPCPFDAAHDGDVFEI